MTGRAAGTRRPGLAFLFAVPIAVLGGLIGLGGAEFRLPVLAGPLRYSARQAVPLNLAVSLVTIVTALLIRGASIDLSVLAPYRLPSIALVTGAVVTAFVGPALASRLSDDRLERVILVLLVAIGTALIIEAFLPQSIGAVVPDSAAVQVMIGILIGLGIGLVSSLLGVAGGELIIPTFVLAFGADIKVAGTASLLVSLPVILVGIGRYISRGLRGPGLAHRDRRSNGCRLGRGRAGGRSPRGHRAVTDPQGRARTRPHRLGRAHLP